jgi:hypothetical protein
MKSMIQSLRQPSAQNRYLFGIPLFKEVENPEIIVDLASNQVNVIACEIHIAGAEFLARSRNILEEKGD